MAKWMDQRFWDHEVADVTREYPDAHWCETIIAGLPARLWRLTMRPVPVKHELYQVLADLDRGYEVCMLPRGRVGHSFRCAEPPEAHPIILPRLKLTTRPYVVELTYPPFPEGPAGPMHPRAKVVDPEMPRRTNRYHPHLYVDTRNDESWACPMSPQATDWSWSRGATRRYLDQVAVWVLKTAVWLATGGGILDSARWLGPATSHHPSAVLASIRPADPCRCGVGRAYGKCHIRSDLEEAIRLMHRGRQR